MGADLIGFLVKGPEKIKLNNIQKQVAEVKFIAVKKFISAYEEFEMEEITREEMLDTWEPIKNFCPSYSDPGMYYSQYCYVDTLDLQQIISDWNNDFPSARDFNNRYDPDDKTQVIVFAGEMSWGEGPDGMAYQYFQFIDLLDLWGCLGLK